MFCPFYIQHFWYFFVLQNKAKNSSLWGWVWFRGGSLLDAILLKARAHGANKEKLRL